MSGHRILDAWPSPRLMLDSMHDPGINVVLVLCVCGVTVGALDYDKHCEASDD